MEFGILASEAPDVLDQHISIGAGISVEWKVGAAGGLPAGLSASSLVDAESGLNLCRIGLGAMKGWVRLHMNLPPATGNLLGIRILVRTTGPATAQQVKPILVSSRTDTGRRSDLVGAKSQPLDLASGVWHEITGTFLCARPEGKIKVDAVLDLPRDAQVDLAAVEAHWFEVDSTAEAAEELKARGAQVISRFRATPVADIAEAVSHPPVYAALTARLDKTSLGVVVTPAAQVFERLPDGAAPRPLLLDQIVAIAPGVQLAKGYRQRHEQEPPADLVIGATAQQPLRLENVTMIGEELRRSETLRLTEARLRDFVLELRGAVVNPRWPGMPVRLRITLGGEELGIVLASSPDEGNLLETTAQGFLFSFSRAIPERLFDVPLEIHIVDSGETKPIRVIVTKESTVPALALPEPPPPVLPPTAKVVGNVEAVSVTAVEGWAVAPEFPDSPVELVLYLNGAPFAYTKTRSYRKDVQALHGGNGYCGFWFELPPNMTPVRAAQLEVKILGAMGTLRKATRPLEAPPGWCEASSLPVALPYHGPEQAEPDITTRVSIIVLNRNGRDLLQEMFDSLQPADLADEIEWIIVDHDSADDSADVCEAFRARGLQIRFVRRRGNYSFSESNNYGVRYATGDILLFANNDLLFPQTFGDTIRRYMADPAIGILGVRLLDHVDAEAARGLAIDQHLGVFFDTELNKSDWVRPFEGRRGTEAPQGETASRAVAVTGAFFALRRADFEAVGGFDEGYSYGLEDVDLCLKVRTQLNKEVVCANDIGVIHHRGFSRQKDTNSGLRRRRNNEIFNRRWGGWLRRNIKRSYLSDAPLWTGRRPVFAFIVSEVGDKTSAGEFYTSLEMGRSLQKLIPCHVRYLPEENWYDLSGVDVVIAMVARFDLAKVKKASPWLVTINWMRQWFDRWADSPSTQSYDHLFASSGIAARFLQDKLGREVGILPIAAGSDTMQVGVFRDHMESDYCFTGSRFGPPREIEYQLDPPAIRGKGKVFGYNWDGTSFAQITAGPLAYSEIPDAYASTKIVLDDANIATKTWGSCNSRVFDSMAAGTLLITNGAAGVQELFGDLVPTFNSRESLTEVLNYWLTHEDERQERVARMQDLVQREHSYDARARTLVAALAAKDNPVRIAIKCAAHYHERAQWGDYHYAMSLAASLRKLGYVARVDCRESWHGGLSNSDDVVIVLRGLLSYRPRTHQTNILWLISHPDDVTQAELRGYDHVYVASEKHSAILAEEMGIPASFLPQCTDTSRFRFEPERIGTRPDRNLYVANSRGVFRDPVRWSVLHELPVDIYGVGWEPFITDARYRGRLVPNEVLGEFYASSRLVICDHWDDMRALGYVSNRLFDVLACGGRLILDRVVGLDSLVPAEFVEVFEDEAGFAALVGGGERTDLDLRRRAAEWVQEHHSFDARARTFAERIGQLMQAAIDTAAK